MSEQRDKQLEIFILQDPAAGLPFSSLIVILLLQISTFHSSSRFIYELDAHEDC